MAEDVWAAVVLSSPTPAKQLRFRLRDEYVAARRTRLKMIHPVLLDLPLIFMWEERSARYAYIHKDLIEEPEDG